MSQVAAVELSQDLVLHLKSLLAQDPHDRRSLAIVHALDRAVPLQEPAETAEERFYAYVTACIECRNHEKYRRQPSEEKTLTRLAAYYRLMP